MARGFCPQLMGATVVLSGKPETDDPCRMCGRTDHASEEPATSYLGYPLDENGKRTDPIGRYLDSLSPEERHRVCSTTSASLSWAPPWVKA
jgi:hypothetical protein